MARRLARRIRKAPPQSLQVPHYRTPLPRQNAVHHRNKKSADAGTLGHLARAWSSHRPPKDIDYRTASYIRTAWPKKSPDSLTLSEVIDLISLWEKTLSPATVFAYIKSLKRFLIFTDQDHGTRLARLVPRHFRPQSRKVTCTDDDFNQIKNHAKPWLRAFLELTRTLALRHNEALALTPLDLNEDTNTLLFRRKDHGSSDLPITPELAAAIRLCKLTNPHQPIIRTLGGPTTQNAVRDAWNRAKKKARANPALIIHDLRRTAIRRAYDNTKDLRICQQIAGHTHLASTLLYLGEAHTDELAQAIRDAAPADLTTMKNATEVKQ